MEKNIKDYVKSNHFFIYKLIYYRGSEENEKKLKKCDFFVDLPFKKCYIICAFDGKRHDFEKKLKKIQKNVDRCQMFCYIK